MKNINNNKEIIEITKDKWDSIPNDYKDVWLAFNNELPDFKGKRCVLSGCISNEIGKLLIEDLHFKIV